MGVGVCHRIVLWIGRDPDPRCACVVRRAGGGHDPACSEPRIRRPGHLVRRADQAADHRAAARHHAAVDGARRRRPARLAVVVATMVGGTLAAGSANALNCYVDRDIDAIMRRTGHRPLARHEVSPSGALVFGLVLGVVAVALMALRDQLARRRADRSPRSRSTSLVYTMLLKRRTAQNIVWGGAAGCMPVLIGWSAVTGSLAWRAGRAVRRGLLLDAAALLGAGDPLPRGLRARRGADAAGRRVAAAGGAARSSRTPG